MRAFTLIIAVAALVIAVIAFARTGGIEEIRHRVEVLSTQTEVAKKTAEGLARLEQLFREKDPTKADDEGGRKAE
ncbi:MAG: hypothetical protein ACE5JN_03170 [Candidatus Methylomirabilia bacterium]